MNRLLTLALAFTLGCSPALPTTDVTAAEAEAAPEGTWAGKTSDENTFVALVSGAGQLQVYFCDGTTDAWLRGAIGSPTARLDGPEGTLGVDLFNERAFGEFQRADGTTLTFDVPRDDGQPLFRAEDSVGGDQVLGGWIRLPDGSQRGAVRVGAVVNTSSLSMVSPALQTAICPQCGSAGPLRPAAFTPASLGDVRANLPRRFTYVALGESYISGEGSPADAGGPFTHDGMLEANAVQEFWGDGLPKGISTSFLPEATRTRLAGEARACHRSDAAASMLARAELARRWTGVSFTHVSFACSGAQVPQLVDSVDTGSADCDQKSGTAKTECYQFADDLPEANAVRPQVEQLDDFISTYQTSVDGVVMSIGGNDMGFGLVIEDCLKTNCAAPGAAGPEAFSRGQNGLPARWATLKQALLNRRVSPSRVALIQYPNPLRKSESAACTPDDYPGDELILKEVTQAEAEAAFDIHRRMNATTGALAADAGWAVESSHVNQTPGHAMCSGNDAWFNTTVRALKTQGVDLPPVPVPIIGPFRVSTGMVHPNAKGHREMYLPAYLAALDRMVAQKFKPAAPARFRVVSSTRTGGRLDARLAWDDRSPSETGYRITAEGIATFMQTTGPDAAGATVSLNAISADREVTFILEATFSSHQMLYSDPVYAVAATRVPEERPVGLAASNSLARQTVGVSSAWSLTWTDVTSRRHAFYTVELVTAGGSVTRRATERPNLVMSPTTATHFRVASCNAIGCGPASSWERLPAGGTGTSSVRVCPNGSLAPAFGPCTSGLTR